MKLRARKVPRECFDFWMFLDVLRFWVPSKSKLPVGLITFIYEVLLILYTFEAEGRGAN